MALNEFEQWRYGFSIDGIDALFSASSDLDERAGEETLEIVRDGALGSL